MENIVLSELFGYNIPIILPVYLVRMHPAAFKTGQPKGREIL
jgi:hypothetical protein